MRKAIFSALCSALVIPGLGQIINKHLKKGVFILLGVFILFIVGIYKISHIIYAVLENMKVDRSDPEVIIATLRAQDISLLWYLLGAFTLLWLYSVLDAHLAGKKIDQLGGEEHPRGPSGEPSR